MRQFTAQILPWNAQDLVIGTCRIKYIECSVVGAIIHSYPGANIIVFFNIVNQYPPLILRSVYIVAGFKDHHCSCPHVFESYRVLLDIICYKFQPLIIVSPKRIATSNNKLVKRNIYSMNMAMHQILQFYAVTLIIFVLQQVCFLSRLNSFLFLR